MQTEIGTDLEKVAELLQWGQIVAIPTESVYGLAANALDQEAVIKVFQAKERPFFDPLIIHTHSIEKMKKWVTEVPEVALKLAKKFSPGPITFVLPKKKVIPNLVTSGLPTVAVRIPNHPLTLELLRKLDYPLAAPSANLFGYVSPTSVAHVLDQLGGKIPYVLDGGPCKVGIESTIISFTDEKPVVLRVGGISIEDIEKIAGSVEVNLHSSSNPAAPGQLDSHYKPCKKVILVPEGAEVNQEEPGKTGVIAFRKEWESVPKANQQILSAKGNLAEAARNIFAALRLLDREGIEIMYAEELPEEGLGRAINDRLRRAASKR
ncbi:MAG: L-threonylcarbamoyladenylate synthase [Bacteroidia bacterium]